MNVIVGRLQRTQRGQAIIEFLMVGVVFLTIIYGIVDLVHMGIIRHALDSACREGARVASTIPALARSNAIVSSRVNQVLMDSKIMSKAGMITSLTPPVLRFSSASADAVNGDTIFVEVSVQYKNLFAIITGNPITITGKATSRYLM